MRARQKLIRSTRRSSTAPHSWAGFHAVPYVLDATYNADGRPIGLQLGNPATTTEPMTPGAAHQAR
jgi:hypothetical protein